MTLGFVASVIATALLQGALVALPRRDALASLSRFRSPRWAVVLPGLIVIGTFGLALVPSGAVDLVVIATFVTPALAVGAALAVVARRMRAAAVLIILGAGAWALLGHGVSSQIGASVITGAGAMLAGAVLVRLLPDRSLLIAIGAMGLIDTVLTHLSVGQTSSQLLDAVTRMRGLNFEAADFGSIATEFPDLLLAAVIGAFVAGRTDQRRLAALVTACVLGYDLALLSQNTIPATPPLCGAVLLYEVHRRLSGPVAVAMWRTPRRLMRI